MAKDKKERIRTAALEMRCTDPGRSKEGMDITVSTEGEWTNRIFEDG